MLFLYIVFYMIYKGSEVLFMEFQNDCFFFLNFKRYGFIILYI